MDGVHVAAELGVADLMVDGEKSIAELAAATSAHPRSLYRLRLMLASEWIFAETADGKFALTDPAPCAILRGSSAIDAVVQPGNVPDPIEAVDLLRLVLLDGRERTEEEFGDLSSRAGLKLTRVVPTPTRCSVIEAMSA